MHTNTIFFLSVQFFPYCRRCFFNLFLYFHEICIRRYGRVWMCVSIRVCVRSIHIAHIVRECACVLCEHEWMICALYTHSNGICFCCVDFTSSCVRKSALKSLWKWEGKHKTSSSPPPPPLTAYNLTRCISRSTGAHSFTVKKEKKHYGFCLLGFTAAFVLSCAHVSMSVCVFENCFSLPPTFNHKK